MTKTQRFILIVAFIVLALMFLIPPVNYSSGRDWVWNSPNIEWKTEHRDLFFWALFTVTLLVASIPRRA